MICSLQLFESVIFKDMEHRPAITEEEKDSDPIYKIVYSKIRNLNKKLSHIQHLETLDRKTLKRPQLDKLSKKEELLKEISDQEEFAIRYKTIVIENNLVNDRVDDLIKIAGLLTVGKRIKEEDYCPSEAKGLYHQIYQEMFNRTIYNKENQLSDEIVRIFRVLDNYLANPAFYSQCKDYMTYIKEIDERSRLQKESIGSKEQEKRELLESVGKITQILHHHRGQLSEHLQPKKLLLISEVIRVESQKTQLSEQLMEFKEQTTRKYSSYQNLERVESLEKNEENVSTNLDSEEAKRDLSEIEPISAEDLNEDSSLFSKKKQECNQIESTALRQSKRRKRNKKRQNYMNVENIRKCSETSLEPTPEKCKVKRVKYVQKIE